MARRIVLLRSRTEPIVWAVIGLAWAALSLTIWIDGLPFEGLSETEMLGRRGSMDVGTFLYLLLPIGLLVASLAIRKAFSPVGVVVRPQGLQIGYRGIVPWSGVKGLGVEYLPHRTLNDSGIIVVELDEVACAAAGVRRTRHRIDTRVHETTTTWVLSAMQENAQEVGVDLPTVTRI
ncbi:MAG: hypothetical protein JKY00_11525 [Roseicyclus sp.]|nr:hypothetical protein [Roseicyclus sp.]